MSCSKILIVDDEAEMSEFLAKELSKEGFTVVQALAGEEAVDKAGSFLPDLILMDILMPNMDGAEAVKELKKDFRTKDIPIIFISGIITQKEIKEITVGDRLYPALAKPFTSRQLLTEISKVMSKTLR